MAFAHLRRPQLMRREVVDLDGRSIGIVHDTWPQDGGGQPEMVLVRVGRPFPRERWLPLERVRPAGDRLQVGLPRWQIEDAPSAEDRRWGDPADIARAYWIAA